MKIVHWLESFLNCLNKRKKLVKLIDNINLLISFINNKLFDVLLDLIYFLKTTNKQTNKRTNKVNIEQHYNWFRAEQLFVVKFLWKLFNNMNNHGNQL